MTIELNLWVAAISGVFGLIILVAAAFAVIRATYTKTQLELLRGRADDYEKEIGRQKGEINDLKVALEIERDARHVLENVVTGKTELLELQELIKKHNKNVEEWIRNHNANVDEWHGSVQDQLHEMMGAIEAIVK